METTGKLHPGQLFSPVTFKQLDGPDYTFGAPGQWQALFVVRGQHCPICKAYLAEIETRRDKFAERGFSVAAVSADSEAQTRLIWEAAKPSFPLLYGLDEATMRKLGVFISEPRSVQETDHRYPEPALFIVNPEGKLHLIDIANAPFLRPDLDRLIRGLGSLIEKNYPIRGNLT